MSTTRPTASAAVLERPKTEAAGAAVPAQAARPTEEPQPQRKPAGGAEFDVAIVGSGPGGYVAAIRASQLGLKAAIIEKGNLGGTCLNVGCIPTKAMLSSVEALATARKGKEYGFTATDVQPAYGAMVKRRDRVVAPLRRGVGMLMRKNSVEVINGLAKFR